VETGLEVGLEVGLDIELKIGFEIGLGPSQDWRLVWGKWIGNLFQDWTGERYGIWIGDWRLDWGLWMNGNKERVGN